MTTDREQFEAWWHASKYCQVIIPAEGWKQIALDVWQAARAAPAQPANTKKTIYVDQTGMVLNSVILEAGESAEVKQAPPAESGSFDESAPPIWEQLAKIGLEAPAGTWDTVPHDLSTRAATKKSGA